MNAGRSWNANTDDSFVPDEAEGVDPKDEGAAGGKPTASADPMSGLMDARFGDDGRLVSGGAGEAGIASSDLHRAVEALARRVKSPPPAADALPATRPSSAADTKSGILEMLDKLESRLDIMGQAAAPRGHGSAAAPAASIPDYRQNFAAIEARIDALASLAGQANSAAGPDIARLGAQMEGLAKADSLVFERMETIQNQLAGLRRSLQGADAPAAAQFAALQERLDEIARSMTGGELTPGALAAIDAHFERLTERIGQIPTGAGPEAPEELWATLENIRAALETLPSRENLSVVDSRIQSLVAKIDAMEVAGAGGETLQKVDTRLQALAGTVAELRDRPDPDSAETHRRLGQLIERIDHLDEKGANVDLGPIEARLADILTRLDGLREESASALAERFDTLSADLGNRSAASTVDGDEIAGQLRAIIERLESTESLSRADLVPIANRIGALESAMRATSGATGAVGALAMPAGGLDDIRDRLDAINARLESDRGGAAALPQVAAVLERLEKAQPTGAGASLALEEKLDRLTHALAALDDLTSLDDVTDLRGDIANLRRELRTMPAQGAEPADSAIVPILQDIAERLNRMPDAAPVTFRDLEDQIGRIVRLIESPETDHGALVQIDARLQDIQTQLSAGAGMAAVAATDGGEAGDMVAVVTEIARSLSADISVLKESAAATEENTRRSMDSVHETLEAVVKRMAFLEGEVDRPAAPASQSARSAVADSAADTVSSGRAAGPAPSGDSMDEMAAAIAATAASEFGLGQPATPEAGQHQAGAAIEIEKPAAGAPGDKAAPIPEISLADDMHADTIGSALSNVADRISLDVDASPAPDAGEPSKSDSEDAGASLLGRLTPSQLLRRATGGRTESFSPDSADPDPAANTGSDLPLEPGTGAPMTSSLDGAPSSADNDGGDLAAASRAAEAAVADPQDMPVDDADHLPGSNDFLMAARRAAQAAAAEAMEAERTNGIANDGSFLSNLVTALNARRYLVLGGALALVIALVLFQFYIKGQLPTGIFGGGTQMSDDMPAAGGSETLSQAGDGMAGEDGIVVVGADQSQAHLAEQEMARADAAAVPPADTGMANADMAGTGVAGMEGAGTVMNGGPDADPVMKRGEATMAATAEPVAMSADTAQSPPAGAVMPPAGTAGTAAEDRSLSVTRNADGRVLATLSAQAIQGGANTTAAQAGGANTTARPDDAVAFGNPQAPMHLQPSSRSAQAETAAAGAAARIVALPGIRETAADASQSAATPAKFKMPPALIGPRRLRRAAAQGDPVAMFEVAVRLAEGRGVPADSAASAIWYRRAAEAGLAPAQYRLGSIYEKGIGEEKNLRNAESWYRRAAIAGNAKAMHNLAVLYAEGASGNPDLAAAAGWFQRAAELGVRDSQFNIAILNARGLGVREDMGEAYKWFAIAARSGDEQAAERRDTVASVLRAEDLNRLAAEAEAFRPKPPAPAANIVVRPIDNWETAGVSEGDLKSPNMVLKAQQLLAAAGYRVGRPDGIFGPRTRRAISEFQRANGLPVSGDIDPLLISALQARGI